MRGLIGFLLCLSACSPAVPSPADQLKVVTYETALQACVLNSQTRAEADACMCDVSRSYGRADAGLCT